MEREKCLETIEQINVYINNHLWMDFEVYRMDLGEIILSGRLDELDDEMMKITFMRPHMVCCVMEFTWEKGIILSLIEGKEHREIAQKYGICPGYHAFGIHLGNAYNDAHGFIIAQEIHAVLNPQY